jgi:putative ATP-binding cassette transporter
MPIANQLKFDRQIWRAFLVKLKAFSATRAGGRARLFFGGLLLMLLVINGLNVLNSYVSRDFMTAIEQKNLNGFFTEALLYIGVFALSTLAAVFYRYAEERLGLLWRHWLTQDTLNSYLSGRTYYRLHTQSGLANPDQRISEDIRELTGTTLSFVLILLNAVLTIIAFSGVLWSISPQLFVVAILYALLGSIFTVLLGRPLVRLNYQQLDAEANFRADLLEVREHSEAVALQHREGRMQSRLSGHLQALVDNFRHIIEVNRNLGFFTTGYSYLIQIIPALVVAPLFIAGEAPFGIIAQSAIGFGHLLGAYSVIINNFRSISNYSAVVARLGALWEAMETANAKTEEQAHIEVCPDCPGLVIQDLSLYSERSGRLLVNALNLSLEPGSRLLIHAPSQSACLALLRAPAGLWHAGQGRIRHAGMDRLLFLPQRPYLPPGTLRQLLLPGDRRLEIDDTDVLVLCDKLNLGPLLSRIGGLEVELDWNDQLSLGEQQMLAVVRLFLSKPDFIFLDRPGSALRPWQQKLVFELLRQRGIGYLTLGALEDAEECYEAFLDIANDGSWQLYSGQPERIQSRPELTANGN